MLREPGPGPASIAEGLQATALTLHLSNVEVAGSPYSLAHLRPDLLYLPGAAGKITRMSLVFDETRERSMIPPGGTDGCNKALVHVLQIPKNAFEAASASSMPLRPVLIHLL